MIKNVVGNIWDSVPNPATFFEKKIGKKLLCFLGLKLYKHIDTTAIDIVETL